MNLIKELILAAVQGVAEIFPISSSGHLVIFGSYLGIPLSINRIIFFHLGTLGVITYYYRDQIKDLFQGKLGKNVFLYLHLSFLTTALVGLAFKYWIPAPWLQSPSVVSGCLFLNGIVIFLVSKFSINRNRKIMDLKLWELILIGAIQGITYLPGISRFGWTLGAGLVMGMGWFDALSLSFLLSIPTLLCANLFRAGESVRLIPEQLFSGFEFPGLQQIITSSTSFAHSDFFLLALVLTTSFCIGFAAIHYLTKYIGRKLLGYFGLYCIFASVFFYLVNQLV